MTEKTAAEFVDEIMEANCLDYDETDTEKLIQLIQRIQTDSYNAAVRACAAAVDDSGGTNTVIHCEAIEQLLRPASPAKGGEGWMFKKSDRIRLSKLGVEQLSTKSLRPNTLGTIIGYSRTPNLTRVKWDCHKNAHTLHVSYLQPYGEKDES